MSKKRSTVVLICSLELDRHIYVCIYMLISFIHLSIGLVKKVKVLVAQSCLTLCDPRDGSLPGSSVYGVLQARVLEWGAIAFSSNYRNYIVFLSIL